MTLMMTLAAPGRRIRRKDLLPRPSRASRRDRHDLMSHDRALGGCASALSSPGLMMAIRRPGRRGFSRHTSKSASNPVFPVIDEPTSRDVHRRHEREPSRHALATTRATSSVMRTNSWRFVSVEPSARSSVRNESPHRQRRFCVEVERRRPSLRELAQTRRRDHRRVVGRERERGHEHR